MICLSHTLTYTHSHTTGCQICCLTRKGWNLTSTTSSFCDHSCSHLKLHEVSLSVSLSHSRAHKQTHTLQGQARDWRTRNTENLTNTLRGFVFLCQPECSHHRIIVWVTAWQMIQRLCLWGCRREREIRRERSWPQCHRNEPLTAIRRPSKQEREVCDVILLTN